jgi:2'-deoxynucleoside 5'-phosphate N-hydrolase
MKIYFGFTIAGDRAFLDHAKDIVALLQELGHEVLTKHVVAENIYNIDRSLPADEVFNRDMKWLRQADMMIAEVSSTSFGVGYEVASMLALGKKAILFYNSSIDKKISLLVKGNTHPNCTVVPYENFSQIEKVLRANL